MTIKRCKWCTEDPIYIAYHDHEWGIPLYDDQALFELLCLEGMQAGLSWITVLKKREAFRKAFDNFDARKIIQYDESKISSLLNNPQIIRNRLKIMAVIANARGFLEIQEKYKTFANYIWQFTDNKIIYNAWKKHEQIPINTPLSDRLSKDLKKYGFKFVGTTICYAYLQAAGIVNDHLVSCFKFQRQKR